MARVLTLQLKRCKLVSLMILIIFSPLALPLALIVKLGDLSEVVLDSVVTAMEKVRELSIKLFKFDKVAIRQRDSGKFKDKYSEERMYK